MTNFTLDIPGLDPAMNPFSSHPLIKRTAHIVVGANYGDEGKGATTLALAKKYKADAGIRFNGGNQAGHTIVVDGQRRVYHSYSCADVMGARSIGWNQFMVSPAYISDERKRLPGAGPLGVHPDTRIITPWDIAANQIKEQHRARTAGGVHGSVGKGIYECYSRDKEISLTAGDLSVMGPGSFARVLEDHFLRNIRGFGIMDPFRPLLPELRRLFDGYAEHVEDLCFTDNLSDVNCAVFEGAQGMLLSMDNKEGFPHLTPSLTDPLEAVNVAIEQGLSIRSINYVTRPYLTRHGAGPIPRDIGFERVDLWTGGSDTTNVDNPWQGKMRYGILLWKPLIDRLNANWNKLPFPTESPPIKRLVITCPDQICREMYPPTSGAFTLAAASETLRNLGWDGQITFLNGLLGEVVYGDDL